MCNYNLAGLTLPNSDNCNCSFEVHGKTKNKKPVKRRQYVHNYTSVSIWNLYFKDWLFILKTLVCAESTQRSVPASKDAVESIELLQQETIFFI